MADSRLRRLERDARTGGPEASAELLRARVRVGQLTRDRVVHAAHLGDASARIAEPHYAITIDCSQCQFRREARNRRNRSPDPVPTHYRDVPKDCTHCKGAERVALGAGLIAFVKEVPDLSFQRELVSWGADCVEHQFSALAPRNPMAFHGRYRLPNQPLLDPSLQNTIVEIRQWVTTGVVPRTIYHYAVPNTSLGTELTPEPALCTAVALAGIEEQVRVVRWRIAQVATAAYRASGLSREERRWQEGRLIQYLLGYA